MFEELKIRYKNLSIKARMVICALLGVLPGAYTYMDSASAIEESHDAAVDAEGAAREKLAKVKSQIKDMKNLEEKLTFTTDQLRQAEAHLPDQVPMDEILQAVGKSAKDANVQIQTFTPAGEQTIHGEYPYNEIHVKVETLGKFGDLGYWMDLVGGTTSRGYVRNWKLSINRDKSMQAKPTDDPAKRSAALSESQREYESALKLRETLDLVMSTELVYYRQARNVAPSPTKEEGKDAKPGDAGAKPKKPDKAGGDGA